jgi:hypothetical protein
MMADNKFEQLKREVLRSGGFFVHFYFDMHGSEPNSLNDIMVGFVSRLTKENGVRMAVGTVEEPIAHDDMFSTTAKVSMLISDLHSLARLAVSYCPIGVEIEEPHKAEVQAGELQNTLMTVSATAQDLTQYILKKGLLSPEERAKFEKQVTFRAELGRRLAQEEREGGGQTQEGKK